MRIGYVLNDFPPLSETFIRREVLALCRAGETVFVYTHYRHRDPLVSEPRHERLTVRQVPFRFDPRMLASAARQDSVEHLHASLMVDAQLAAFAAARELSVPFTITAYSGHTVFTASPSLYQELSHHDLCGGIVVEDPFMRDWVVERLGADPQKVEQIANSLDLDDYRLPGTRPARSFVRILSIARFIEKKGLVHLVEAFRKLESRIPEVELWLIGSGPEEDRLRAAAGDSRSIHFLGLQPEAKCREAYQESDIFCLPCVRAADGDADGIPTTVFEAMAYELPVVVSDLLSAPYYVRNECEGLLAQPGDSEGLAGLLERLCRDEALRRRMGQLGRRRVEELNDLSKNVGLLRDLFRRTRARRWQQCLDQLTDWRRQCTTDRLAYHDTRKQHAVDYFQPAGGRMLEVGCGGGSLRLHLPPGVSYFGCDPLPQFPACRQFPFVHCGAEQLPFHSECFDSVVLYSVLSYLMDAEAALAEAARVLKPGGRLLLSECVNDPNPLHLNHHTEAWVREQVSARFRLLDLRGDGEMRILAMAEKPAPATTPAAAAHQEPRPLVSVAITAYNRERFVAGCIESVLRQTYSPLEIVVVDDGSTDGTPGVLEQYADRVRIFRHERNLGVAAAKNRALRMTSESARYVALLDSDDYFHPEFVERSVACLERNSEEGVVYVNEVVIDEWDRELWRRVDDGAWSADEWLRTRNLRGDGWMGRRDLVMRTELHDESMPMDVDYDLFYQLLEITRFQHVPEPLLYVQHHPQQLTRDAMTIARCHAANLVKYGYSAEYAYLRAVRNPEWIPAIEEGVALGKRMRAARERRKRRAAAGGAEALAIEGGKPVREQFLVFGAPSLGQEEIDEVTATLRSGWIGSGPRAARFEQEFAAYVGAEHAVSLNSCTAGLFLSLVTLGIGPGDEVITTPLTFAATVNVIEHVGARPVFADIDSETLNIDPQSVERAITPRTRAILAVHFGGLPCDLDALEAVARPRGIPMVEDAAHAVGARYGGRMIGGGRNAAVFSFYGNKNLTTAEGGMITTPDAALAERIRIRRMHGQSSGAWEHFADRSLAPAELVAAGYKFNMPDFAAALGLPQLRKQESLLRVRQEHARRYDEALRDLPLRVQARPAADDAANRHSLHLYVIALEEGRWRASRDRVVETLRAENIGATVHYPLVHLARYYREKYGFAEGLLPVAEQTASRLLTLPLSPSMSALDAEDVIEALHKVAARYAANL